MQRTAAIADPDADRLVLVVTDPAPEADLYDYPGAYAQRFDAVDPAAVEPQPEVVSEVYFNHFESIPDGWPAPPAPPAAARCPSGNLLP